MRSIHHAIHILVTAGLLMGLPAQAARSSLSVSHAQIRLLDLDLTDGITPSISFVSSSTELRYFYSEPGRYGSDSQSLPQLGALMGPLTFGDAYSQLTAQSFGGDLLSSQGWSGSVSVSNLAGPTENWAAIGLRAHFTLSANTLLLVSADVAPPQLFAANSDITSAEAAVRLDDMDNATVGTSRTYWEIHHGTHSQIGTDHLQASFANVGATSTDGQLTLRLVATSTNNAFASPVPEPSSAVLLLAGIAALGTSSRRRFQVTTHRELRVTADVPTLAYDEEGHGLSNVRTLMQVGGNGNGDIPWQSVMLFSGIAMQGTSVQPTAFPHRQSRSTRTARWNGRW